MDDRKDLVERLCTLAGMIFEDASAIAIQPSGTGRPTNERIEAIKVAAENAGRLADAALVVQSRPR